MSLLNIYHKNDGKMSDISAYKLYKGGWVERKNHPLRHRLKVSFPMKLRQQNRSHLRRIGQMRTGKL